jgi:hypothetical protein
MKINGNKNSNREGELERNNKNVTGLRSFIFIGTDCDAIHILFKSFIR